MSLGPSQASLSSHLQTRVPSVLQQKWDCGEPYIHGSVGGKEQAQDLGTKGRALVPTWHEMIVIKALGRRK